METQIILIHCFDKSGEKPTCLMGMNQDDVKTKSQVGLPRQYESLHDDFNIQCLPNAKQAIVFDDVISYGY